jgi:hypothetical protein
LEKSKLPPTRVWHNGGFIFLRGKTQCCSFYYIYNKSIKKPPLRQARERYWQALQNMQTLEHIIELEESENYISAFEEYRKEFSVNQDFELWKSYYFFLWYIVVEDSALGIEKFVI